MKTKDVCAVFGRNYLLADLLGITAAAISIWGEEVPILRQYQLRDLMPDIDKEIAKVQRLRKLGWAEREIRDLGVKAKRSTKAKGLRTRRKA